MKRQAALALTLGLLLTPAAANAVPLSEPMAWDYADHTLADKYSTWDHRQPIGPDLACRKRINRHARNCKIDWTLGGDVSYRTILRVVWHGSYTNYRVRVAGHTIVTNYYCLNTNPKSKWGKCTSHHRVGPRFYRFHYR